MVIKPNTEWYDKNNPQNIVTVVWVDELYVRYVRAIAPTVYEVQVHVFVHKYEAYPTKGVLKVTANNILEAAVRHMRDRASTYDKPEGERSMGATVQAFRAITGHDLTEEQGWLFMQVLKAVRSQQGAYRADSYEDAAAYVALAGEAAARDRT